MFSGDMGDDLLQNTQRSLHELHALTLSVWFNVLCIFPLLRRGRPRAIESQISSSLVSDLKIVTLRDGVVYTAALQQIIFNADSAILERMIRDQGRTTQDSLSSQELAFFLYTHVLFWMVRRRFRCSLLSPSR